MKRIITLTAIMIFAVASMALATTQVASPSTVVKFQSSANVVVVAAASFTTFAAASKHLNGTRTYGVSSTSTAVKYTETILPGTAITTSLFTASDSSAFSAWSSM